MTKMRIGDEAYTRLVEKEQAKIRGNVVSKVMTKAECAEEISAIVGPFTPMGPASTGAVPLAVAPKKRGRPLGSRNKPK